MTRKPMMNKCRKPSFFKVLIGDFSKRLLIPPEFTKNLVWNGIFPHKCALRGPSGLLCAVEVESTENGMFFQNGWECLVKDHHLELGDFLIFRYDGESKFSVTIYDRSACEKDVEIAKRRSGSSVSLKNTRNQARVKVEVLDDLVAESFKNINSEDETVVSDEECCNDVKLGKRPASGYLEVTSDGSILFKSENSCFQRILTKHSKYHIGFPKELGVAKDLMNIWLEERPKWHSKVAIEKFAMAYNHTIYVILVHRLELLYNTFISTLAKVSLMEVNGSDGE
ncbi:hypothetical protein ACLB2K_053143 [Fragaria x ananassa]